MSMKYEDVQSELHPRVDKDIFGAVLELYRTDHLDEEGANKVLFEGATINAQQCRTGERKYGLRILQKQAEMIEYLDGRIEDIQLANTHMIPENVSSIVEEVLAVLRADPAAWKDTLKRVRISQGTYVPEGE